MTVSSLMLFLTMIEGLAVFLQLIFLPPESGLSGFMGFSNTRLAILSVILLGNIASITAFILSIHPNTKKIRSGISSLIHNEKLFFVILLTLYSVFFFSIQILFLIYSPVRKWDSSVQALSRRINGLLFWGVLSALQLYLFFRSKVEQKVWAKLHSSLFPAAMFLIIPNSIYGFLCWILGTESWFYRIEHFEWYVFLPLQIFLFGKILQPVLKNHRFYTKLCAFYGFFQITLITFVVYRMTGQWVGRWNTPAKSYWHLLADAFFRGELFLADPDTTHDLTFYNGHWFVPNPPLPAIIMMPLIKIFGLWTFNTTLFSTWVGAINTGLIFLIFRKASQKGLIPDNRSGILWLTVVFAIGTNHWWLSILGQMWFVSQVLTVTFCELAVLSVLSEKSPFLTGSMLGLAILARPNIFAVYPFLLGIYYFIQKGKQKIQRLQLFRWTFSSAVPIVISVFLLLYYNFLRFNNWFDFGYVTIHGASWIVSAVKEYGMFHPHFLKTNLSVMLFRIPQISINSTGIDFNPGIMGYSIFFMTPPLIFIFRNLRKNWWNVGAWISILVSLSLLLMYHNTGAEQIGYRYMMDFILPLFFLMAQGIGKKTPLVFAILTIAAILINAISIYWWFLGRAL